MTVRPASATFTDPDLTNGEAKQAQDDMLEVLRELPGGDAEAELTITSGSITPTASTHSVDTEGDAASDDLTTIVTNNHPDGRLLLLRCASGSRTVVVKHNAGGAGQVALSDGADLKLRHTSMWLLLKRTGTDWEEVARSYGANKADALAFRAPATGAALTAGGTANAATLTYPVAPDGYVTGVEHAFKAAAANTGPMTLNINGLGDKDVYRPTPGGMLPLFGGEIVAGQIVTVVYDGTRFVLTSPFKLAFRGALVWKNGNNQSLANGTDTVLAWGTTVFDTAGTIVDGGGFKLVVPAGATKVRLVANVRFAASATGQRYASMTKNGLPFTGQPLDLRNAVSGGSTTALQLVTAVLDVVAGDFFQVIAWQNSGGSLNAQGTQDTWFAMEVIE